MQCTFCIDRRNSFLLQHPRSAQNSFAFASNGPTITTWKPRRSNSCIARVEFDSSVLENASSMTTKRKFGESLGDFDRPYCADSADARIVKASLAFWPPDFPVVA